MDLNRLSCPLLFAMAVAGACAGDVPTSVQVDGSTRIDSAVSRFDGAIVTPIDGAVATIDSYVPSVDAAPGCECSSGPCCDGCHYHPSSFVCDGEVSAEYSCEAGTECGDDVYMRPQIRYCPGTGPSCTGTLSWGSSSVYQTCSSSERCDSSSFTCASCCDATAAWTPSSTSTNATGNSGTVLRLELRSHAADSGIDIRVCKTTGTFFNPLYVQFDESASGFLTTIFSGSLNGTGSSCTPWGELSYTSTWPEGDVLGGDVMVVSPASCFSEWDWDCGGSPSAACTSSGDCWMFSTPNLTRTCL